ncbi:MAG: TIGR04283 family arsenosugar biosynthesis glycosyltransferase [Steroidobacteraceae bacterium]
MRLALIVPTLDDDTALAHFLTQLAGLDLPPDEVIVVDGGSRSSTAQICRDFGCTWMSAQQGRGVQLRAGAARANADALWFVHADCQLHPDASKAIRAAIATGEAGGYFRFQFGGERRALKRFLEWCIAWRCRAAMVYGDQGIFATRSAYDASPGFSAQPLFEEVALVRALKRSGRFAALALPIIVSSRRWERDGFLRRTLHNRALALGFLLGIDSMTLARWYRTRVSQ